MESLGDGSQTWRILRYLGKLFAVATVCAAGFSFNLIYYCFRDPGSAVRVFTALWFISAAVATPALASKWIISLGKIGRLMVAVPSLVGGGIAGWIAETLILEIRPWLSIAGASTAWLIASAITYSRQYDDPESKKENQPNQAIAADRDPRERGSRPLNSHR